MKVAIGRGFRFFTSSFLKRGLWLAPGSTIATRPWVRLPPDRRSTRDRQLVSLPPHPPQQPYPPAEDIKDDETSTNHDYDDDMK